MTFPDLAALVRRRLAEPMPLLREWDAATIGRLLLRQLEDHEPPGGRSALRGSKLGACARQLSYRIHGETPAGRERDHRSASNFAIGDAWEALLVVALDDALQRWGEGWTLTGVLDEQEDAVLRIDGLEIPLHRDGRLIAPDGVSYGLEVKSTNTFGADSWQRGVGAAGEGWGPEDAYWWQLQGGMLADSLPAAYVLAGDKQSGHVFGWWQWCDEDAEAELGLHLWEARLPPGIASRTLPDNTHLHPARDISTATGKPLARHGRLPWQCVYCDFWRTCWPTAEVRLETARGRKRNWLYVRED